MSQFCCKTKGHKSNNQSEKNITNATTREVKNAVHSMTGKVIESEIFKPKGGRCDEHSKESIQHRDLTCNQDNCVSYNRFWPLCLSQDVSNSSHIKDNGRCDVLHEWCHS